MITYYVSGDDDIEPTSDNLAASGRAVQHGAEYGPQADVALREGESFVVIAHGNESGTVFYRPGVAAPQAPWLWVGMQPYPVGARVYLYCCKAGPRISEFLNECECVGHADSVPMPTAPDTDEVLEFLDAVDELMVQEKFERETWRRKLRARVAEKLLSATQRATPENFRPVGVWAMLAKSLA